MNDRKQQLEAIFDAAIGLESMDGREVYLARRCGEDLELRCEVEALIRAYEKAGGFLTHSVAEVGHAPAAVASGTMATPPAEEGPGAQIACYKLREKIGEGGCGVVYVAEQEEPIRRRVALKVIKPGMDTKSVIARFEVERQALAMMDHPNIAKVLDAGSSDTGRPYFVMELVRGARITDYCDQHQLTTQQRLELFIQICCAVQHAHQKGIIHRDLKPSNILVTVQDAKPVPKVIDFGIAKATEGRLTDKTLYTEFQQFIGTPAYMSPEQAELTGTDVDTRSDIYSLGVLLYELLTGQTPFNAKELLHVGLDEMRRTIREKEPPKPSTRLHGLAGVELTTTAHRRQTEAPKLLHQVRGDLDWIVMKCLEKDRARRYATANGLAVDVGRHLKGEPVAARPPSAAYRLQKFAYRHRAAAVGLAVVLLALLSGGIVATSALLRERAANGRERGARRQADQRLRDALVFVNDVFDKVAPEMAELVGAASARERLGKSGLRFMQRLRAGGGDDPVLRAALARLLLKVSQAQDPGIGNSVGEYEAGLQRAEEAIGLLSTDSSALGSAERLNLLFLAKWARVDCMYGLGRWEEGALSSKELEALLDDLKRLPQFSDGAETDRVNIRNNTGAAMVLAGRPKEAIEQYFQPILKSGWAVTISNTSSERQLRNLLCPNDYSATAYGLLRQFQPMRQAADEAVRIAELLLERFPSNARYKVGRAFSCSQQGYAMLLTGETAEGLSRLRKSREEVEDLIRQDRSNDQFKQMRAMIAANQTLAFARWSEDTSALLTVRHERLFQAEAFLADADEFCRAARAKEPQVFCDAACADVVAARAKLATDETGPSQP